VSDNVKVASAHIWEDVELNGRKFQRLVVAKGHVIPDGVSGRGRKVDEQDAGVTPAPVEGVVSKAVDGPPENKARGRQGRKG
jgi:hypothetical protein